jgi:omega-amidase
VPAIGTPPSPTDAPSLCALSALAATHSVWIVGGSVAERDADGKLFNTSTIWNARGELVAVHRKVHLVRGQQPQARATPPPHSPFPFLRANQFDIDIPGRMTFRESDTLSPGAWGGARARPSRRCRESAIRDPRSAIQGRN